jgi:hypothetical protein
MMMMPVLLDDLFGYFTRYGKRFEAITMATKKKQQLSNNGRASIETTGAGMACARALRVKVVAPS